MKAIITALLLGLAVTSTGVIAAEFSNSELEDLGKAYTQAMKIRSASLA